MKKLHTRKGGFTLIELMIVVAIIGILAAIAIPNFLRFQLKAKSSEGKTNLAAIRTAEQSYYSEFGVYVSADVSPAGAPGSAKRAFVPRREQRLAPARGLHTLGWSPEGNVYFSYAVGTGAAGTGFFATAQRRHRRERRRRRLGATARLEHRAGRSRWAATPARSTDGQPDDQVVPVRRPRWARASF